MKKFGSIAVIIMLLALSFPHNAEAFLLPPFKTDFTNTLQQWYTTVKTKVVKTKKKIEESTFIQTTIQYGKGAKEVWDYKNSLSSYKDIDLKMVGSLASQFKKIDKKKTYSTFSKINEKILTPALEEINLKSDIEVSYTTKRVGRKIQYINFSIKEKKIKVAKKSKCKSKYVEHQKILSFNDFEQRQYSDDYLNNLADELSGLK